MPILRMPSKSMWNLRGTVSFVYIRRGDSVETARLWLEIGAFNPPEGQPFLY